MVIHITGEVVRAIKSKMQDLEAEQAQVLESVIKQIESGTLSLTDALRFLHRNFIDIYPSSLIDEGDEDETDH